MTDRFSTPLTRELQTFEEKVLPLKDKQGKFVVIHQDEVYDFFNDYEDALSAAYKRYGLEPFLVKQVGSAASIAHYTRDLVFQ